MNSFLKSGGFYVEEEDDAARDLYFNSVGGRGDYEGYGGSDSDDDEGERRLPNNGRFLNNTTQTGNEEVGTEEGSDVTMDNNDQRNDNGEDDGYEKPPRNDQPVLQQARAEEEISDEGEDLDRGDGEQASAEERSEEGEDPDIEDGEQGNGSGESEDEHVLPTNGRFNNNDDEPLENFNNNGKEGDYDNYMAGKMSDITNKIPSHPLQINDDDDDDENNKINYDNYVNDNILAMHQGSMIQEDEGYRAMPMEKAIRNTRDIARDLDGAVRGVQKSVALQNELFQSLTRSVTGRMDTIINELGRCVAAKGITSGGGDDNDVGFDEFVAAYERDARRFGKYPPGYFV